MKEDRILAKLKDFLDEKRYRHSLGVGEAAERLAILYGEDKEKARLAGLVHDCARCFPPPKLIELSKEFHIELDELCLHEIQLIHGILGARIAQKEFHIHDPYILDAIEYHTTGRKNMTLLDKIICLADYIEPNRDYAGVDQLRQLAVCDLDEALICAFDKTIQYVICTRGLLHPRTIEARNDLLLARL